MKFSFFSNSSIKSIDYTEACFVLPTVPQDEFDSWRKSVLIKEGTMRNVLVSIFKIRLKGSFK
jgi:hypothetical protein